MVTTGKNQDLSEIVTAVSVARPPIGTKISTLATRKDLRETVGAL
jgi:hypothetical protein